MTRRYRTATSKEQNLAALPVIAIGFILVGVVAYLYLDTRGAQPEVLLLTTPGLALIVGGWFFFAATFVASGQKRWSAPLDEIVPLAITTVRRSLPNSERCGSYSRHARRWQCRRDSAILSSTGV